MGMKQRRCQTCGKRRPWNEGAKRPWRADSVHGDHRGWRGWRLRLTGEFVCRWCVQHGRVQKAELVPQGADK